MISKKKLMEIGVMAAFSVYWWLLGCSWDGSWQVIGLALAGILCCSAYLYLSLHNPDVFETIYDGEPCLRAAQVNVCVDCVYLDSAAGKCTATPEQIREINAKDEKITLVKIPWEDCEEDAHLFVDPDEVAICEICDLPVKKIDAHIGKKFTAQTGFARQWTFIHQTCHQKQLEE